MGLLTLPRGELSLVYTNQDGPSTTPGTSVTPGASSAEGSATVIATGAQMAADIYWLDLWVTGGNTTATSKMHLLDIGIDPAGGTSYQWRVNNLECGGSASAVAGGIRLGLPLFIPAGSQVAVRIQGLAGTAGTVRVQAKFYGKPQRPELAVGLVKAETLGTVAGSSGVAVTPGVSAAEGSWTSIGTTTFPWRFCLPTFQLDDSTTNSQIIHLDVAFGDGSNKVIVRQNIQYYLPGSAEVLAGGDALGGVDGWCNIPAGATIYVRLSTNIATADSNYDVLVTGLG